MTVPEPGAEKRTASAEIPLIGGGESNDLNLNTDSLLNPNGDASAENRTLPSVKEILRHTDKLFDGALMSVRYFLDVLDAELDDTSLSVMDIGFALRQTKPEVQFVLIVAAGQEVESASLSPVATLTKPVSMPDLGRLLERITNPASTDQQEESPTPLEPISAQTGDNSTSPLWLTDVSKAAQQLTQLNLESSAQAAFITRNHELWAYAGQLSREAAQELTDSIQRYWDAKGESDLLRFVRLQATEAQHMLYVRKLSDNMTLALVFFIWLVGLAAFVFWLWVLIDILKSEFTGLNKIVWLLAVILLPLLGAVLYWFIGREQKVRNELERPLE